MPELLPEADWQCLGASVPGSSHLRQGLPNQDALAFEHTDTGLLLSVSDGHGSPHCFRSEVGSRLAVDLFVSELRSFLAGNYGEDWSLIKRLAEERLPRQITRLWQEQVMAHYQAHPVSDAEWQALSERKGPEARDKIEQQPLLIYGATLLGVAITDTFILTLQLGDGEILEADANGEISAVLPADDRLFANETTSLCNENAWRDYRFRFQVRTEEASPIFLLLTTDGYFNSFRERSGFYQVGSDLLEMLHEDGPDPIRAEMPLWLSEATAAGSGDDATLLIAWSGSGLQNWASNRPVKETLSEPPVPTSSSVPPETSVELPADSESPDPAGPAQAELSLPETSPVPAIEASAQVVAAQVVPISETEPAAGTSEPAAPEINGETLVSPETSLTVVGPDPAPEIPDTPKLAQAAPILPASNQAVAEPPMWLSANEEF